MPLLLASLALGIAAQFPGDAPEVHRTPRVLLLPVRAERGAPSTSADAVSNALREHLLHMDGLRLLNATETCPDDACALELGRRLDADEVVSGVVRGAPSLTVVLTRHRVSDGRLAGTVRLRLAEPGPTFATHSDGVVRQLLGRDAIGKGLPPLPAPEPPPPVVAPPPPEQLPLPAEAPPAPPVNNHSRGLFQLVAVPLVVDIATMAVLGVASVGGALAALGFAVAANPLAAGLAAGVALVSAAVIITVLVPVAVILPGAYLLMKPRAPVVKPRVEAPPAVPPPPRPVLARVGLEARTPPRVTPEEPSECPLTGPCDPGPPPDEATPVY